MTPYRHYTNAEIEAANETDLPDLLSSLGYHVKRVGRFHTTREMDSLRIRNRRTWFRYSERRGGDAIAFMRHFCDLSFQESVQYLLNFNGYSVDTSIPLPRQKPRPPPQRERPTFILPPPNIDNERVRTYLRGRGICPTIIDSFIKSGLLYEDAQHHDCVFVGRDQSGKAVFASKRGTRDYNSAPFKGDARGANKRIAFRLRCEPALNAVYVFEAPIDLMSWFTLYDQPMSNAVALCGLYDGPLETYLNENPHIRRIIFCLDADMPGREATGKLGMKYQALGYETEIRLPPSGKDWNEHLQGIVGRAKWDNDH